ncbi:MAG: hypothetical protein AAF483_22420 [Planctomycetota bacterium]
MKSVGWVCGLTLFFLSFCAKLEVKAQNLPEAFVDAMQARSARLSAMQVSIEDGPLTGTVYCSRHGTMSEWVNEESKVVTRTVSNPDYSFQVKEKNGKYFLSGVRKPGGKRTNFEKLLAADLELILPETNSFGVDIMEFDDPLQFSVESTGLDYVSLKCLLQNHEFLVLDGIYTLRYDPQRDNRRVGASLEHPTRQTKIEIQYSPHPEWEYCPSVLEIRSEYPGYPESAQRYKLLPPEKATVNAAEFRLPFYGIEESAVGISSRSPMRLALVVMLAVSSGIVFLVWRKMR